MNKFKFLINYRIKRFGSFFWQVTSFILLLFLYLTSKLIIKIISGRVISGEKLTGIIQSGRRIYFKLVKILEYDKKGSISRLDLIDLSLRNLKAKRNRTVITLGGMAIGIGAIVFLVSVGYGLQNLVVSRVARLEEMKQAEIVAQAGSKIKINDKTVADFKNMTGVKEALPLIAIVGKISYQNSVSDMAVFGVTSDYLRLSAIKPVEGKIFESNELVSSMEYQVSSMGEVAGAKTEKQMGEYGQEIQAVEFSIQPGEWVKVRSNPSTKALIIGYTKRTEGQQTGEEVWGGEYNSNEGELLGRWLKAKILLWEKKSCSPDEGECEDGQYVVLRDEENRQAEKTGYFAEINLNLENTTVVEPKVLGVRSDATDSGAVNWIEIASEAGVIKPPETKNVTLADNAKREAVVNRAMLKILAIKETEAVGKKFQVAYSVVGELLENREEKIESLPAEYAIVGVVPDEKAPFFYVPFMDLRSLGIANYSQVKIVTEKPENLAKIRRQIETMGFITNSVSDTVAQIGRLFSTFRLFLGLLGTVALTVAALGMFNTLTISLLERTREVGLMKAIGMKSSEVQELFLTESLVLGFFGGIIGIMLGFVGGKLLGFGLSFLAIFKGLGFIDVASLPLPFIILTLFLSLLVGILTGIYPAQRATKISALNALRYE